MSELPLAGVRVVDVTRFVAGPLSTFFLASMGAEVIAVERPGGEQSRLLAPFGRADGGSSTTPVEGGMSVPYLKRGRGKRSVAVALDAPDGRSLVARLAAVADVFVENSRPGVMERLGLGYSDLAAANPALIYASISGYGQTGPRAGAPAMDQAVQAASGLMAKTGFPDGPPVRTGAAVGDFSSAAFAAMGVLGALRQRDRTGRGPARRSLDARCADRARVGRTGRPLRGDGNAGADGKRRPARCADQRVPGGRRLGRGDPHHNGTVEAAGRAARPAGVDRRARRPIRKLTS